ncbi:aminoglycoside phosphotransferase (APT) family kinase protein [Planifilum fimeticola]|uniref:Aminoglycoside phosphotransferase (APT) family kinase protein n=1 Tax=Planifilum fimeticola TaxID=201975 RepID=A0A2T0LFM6_9BACL|nr:phosphotransferase family protein [Planifilum fimeticola]PRX41011.1 aminoglycoside phosphotransferase (APT) family kinase protein [Planifilum fimeticola]
MGGKAEANRTIPVREGEDFDREKVERFLRENLRDLGPEPLEVSQFPAGASNLTYSVRIGDWEAVLRRPPLGPVPPKAHDMVREATLLSKLHRVFPLAPKPFVICRDSSVIGAPFYVMERREGVVLDDAFPPEVEPTEELCRGISRTVVETLVKLHAVDWREAGLDGFGRPDGFLKRQVGGWIDRYHRSRTDEIPEIQFLTRWLADHVPESPAPTMIHNDFKLNNMLLDPEDLTKVVAVLDWEMTTVGDPLFDLAVSLSYWVERDDPEEMKDILPTVTPLPGFMTRAEMMELYARLSDRDLSSMHFYMTFAYFKLAVILQQIYFRWKRGQTRDRRFASFGERVRRLIRHAAELAERGRL